MIRSAHASSRARHTCQRRGRAHSMGPVTRPVRRSRFPSDSASSRYRTASRSPHPCLVARLEDEPPLPTMSAYEGLGVFYLGREVDPATSDVTDAPVLYDAADLTTHAFIVGMTGSGKTGLGVGLIEEAALDGIPVIAIDPKGDLGNLALQFPAIEASDFRPWIDESEATRDGISPDDLAAQKAESWQKGLASWDQPAERIARLKAAADVRIYTPGSDAGLPVSVLGSLSPPDDEPGSEAFRDRVDATVGGLLTLVEVDADASSGESVFLSQVVDRGVGPGPRPRGRRPDPGVARPAVRDPRRDAGRRLLPRAKPQGARDEAERAHCLTELPGLDARRAPRRRPPVLRRRRQAAGVGDVHRAPRRRRAAVLRDAGYWARCSRGCASSPARARCARSCTWTRSSATSRPAPTRRRRRSC